jgi:hypothetical protein
MHDNRNPNYVNAWFALEWLLLVMRVLAYLFVFGGLVIAALALVIFGHQAMMYCLWALYCSPVIIFIATVLYVTTKPKPLGPGQNEAPARLNPYSELPPIQWRRPGFPSIMPKSTRRIEPRL